MQEKDHQKKNIPDRDTLEPKQDPNEFNKGRHGTPPPPAPKPQQDETNESEGLPGWTPPKNDE